MNAVMMQIPGISPWNIGVNFGVLGEKEEARQSYDQAVEWMEKNRPEDEELLRFRAEAAELLGIGETPPAEKEKPESEDKDDG